MGTRPRIKRRDQDYLPSKMCFQTILGIPNYEKALDTVSRAIKKMALDNDCSAFEVVRECREAMRKENGSDNGNLPHLRACAFYLEHPQEAIVMMANMDTIR